jgi:DNA polymerase-3 subunit delta
MTVERILTDLKNRKFYPVYFLTGEESYYIDQIAAYIEDHVVEESQKDFNLTVLYGKDVDAAAIIGQAKRYPMMSDHQVVIVKEAQDVKNIEELQPYLEQPLGSTLLVLCYKYKKIDKRRIFVKTVEKKGVFFESARLYENKIPEWIRIYLQEKGYSITPKASVMLTEFLGTDLTRIANELGKLQINAPAGSVIDEKLVELQIGIHKDFNVFELQKALGVRDTFKAYQIAAYFAGNPRENPLPRTLSILHAYFLKLMLYHQLKDKSRNSVASALGINPFFVQDYQSAAQQYPMDQLIRIMGIFREYDLKSKGIDNVSADDGELLKEMIFKILHKSHR